MKARFMLITVIAVAALAFALPAAAQDDSAPDYPVNTITVTGNGSAAGTPDIANIEIGVETRDPDVATAFTNTNTTINEVINAITAAGIPREDIRTVNLNVYQERFGAPGPMESGMGQEAEVNYVVSNMIRVTVRDINQVANVINTAVEAGATNIFGLNFGIEDQDALASDARAEAMQDARDRAQQLADLAGLTLGDVIIVEEGGAGGMFDVMNMSVAREQGFGGGAAIEPGQLSVSVSLRVTFRTS